MGSNGGLLSLSWRIEYHVVYVHTAYLTELFHALGSLPATSTGVPEIVFLHIGSVDPGMSIFPPGS
jgi:hypothetical protein